MWWIILYAVFIGLNSLGSSVSFRFALVVALISIGVLVTFAVKESQILPHAVPDPAPRESDLV